LILFTHTFQESVAQGQVETQIDALAQGIINGLQLNVLMLVIFGVALFFLVHLIGTQTRTGEFRVLRTMGFSIRSSLIVLGIEGGLVLSLGLLAGVVIGNTLSHIMIPYLSLALAESLGSVPVERLLVNWSAVAQLVLLLVVLYGSALTLSLFVQALTQAHWNPWTGDE
jgi:ABC-type antimicrobial peptide transport system permease subunit